MSSGRKGRVGPNKVKKGSALGRSLMRDKKKVTKSHRARMRDRSKFHTTTECDGLKSVYETNDLEAFLTNAEMAGRTFTAARDSAVIVGEEGFVGPTKNVLENAAGPMRVKGLQIPKRPKWNKSMTPEELDETERMSFLKWRRSLASITETVDMDAEFVVTPFEKNIEVWRQLWRVLERSDIVLQIVDVRNPDLYRSKDLEEYVKALGDHKRYILLLNKADYMPDELRERWCATLRRENVNFLFFSAKASQQILDEEEEKAAVDASKEEEDGEEEDGDEDGEEDDDKKDALAESGVADEDVDTKRNDASGSARWLNTPRVLSREEFIALLDALHAEASVVHGRSTSVVGTVGFPNVGKSSLINVLMAVTKTLHTTKRVAVGATPGKTKHFQTLELSNTVTLCDCPGLVFPVFVRSKADMVVNGILPIDQLREYLAPVALVCRRIPRVALKQAYALENLRPRPDAPAYTTAKHLLASYAKQRGYYRAAGSGPDMARSARYILKDYASGKLLFCFPPADGLPPPSSSSSNGGDDVVVVFGGDSTKRAKESGGEFTQTVRTADGFTAVLSTREARVAEEDSAFAADLLDELGLMDDLPVDTNVAKQRGDVTRNELMSNSSNPMDRRRAGKKGKGKGAGRRGRHGRDRKPYEEMEVLKDLSFVRDDAASGKSSRRRKKGAKGAKRKSHKDGVTFLKPF